MSYLENTQKYEKNIYMALLAQQCSRYEEMFKFLEDLLIKRGKDFSIKERELLAYGYISYIKEKRKALHIILAYETKEKKNENSIFLPLVQEYRRTIESELTQSLQNIINILDSLLIKKAENNESKMYYKKLKGDFNRYIAEYAKDELRERVMKDGLLAYQDAKNLSKDFPIMNEILLGLHLNMSLFYYEVINERKNAIKIADECIQRINKEMNDFDEDDEKNKVIVSLIRLIKENYENWKIEEEEQNK